MTLKFNSNTIRWLVIAFSFIIICLILWHTYAFFQNFKAEERYKMQNWSLAQKEISVTTDLDKDYGELSLQIITGNTTTPMINVDANGNIINTRNIDISREKDTLYLKKLISKFKQENQPIKTVLNGKVFSTLYYGDSNLLKRLKYYPLALMVIIFLFATVIYLFYKSAKTAEQNKLWTGMAKETAHQIGTPLSSLAGWTEILRSEAINPEYIVEIEKDIERLKTITDRFNKIGSIPKLTPNNIVEETKNAYNYLKARTSKLITFKNEMPTEAIYSKMNNQLYSWTIENLVKNAIDAMKGRGDLTLTIFQSNGNVFVELKDTGKGILKSDFNKIFNPGYTTKKRGWGLGLSLAKRIIEDYHRGKIKVLESSIGHGTTFQIKLNTIEKPQRFL